MPLPRLCKTKDECEPFSGKNKEKVKKMISLKTKPKPKPEEDEVDIEYKSGQNVRYLDQSTDMGKPVDEYALKKKKRLAERGYEPHKEIEMEEPTKKKGI